tara:strand:- start:90 stop:338 length:249 start_codon:yes stop_codon:yes gene_type:complete
MLDKNKPQLRINLNRKLAYELNYGIQNNILSLSVPIENSDKKIKVNFHIVDILSPNGYNIKKVFVSEINSDKDNLLQFSNKK